MPEQVYQAVWCQVFAATCVRLHAEDEDHAILNASVEADWAAANAVEKWDDARRTTTIVAANKVKEAGEG